MKSKKSQKSRFILKYPSQLLEPIRQYLADRLSGLEKREKDLRSEDPFSDSSRLDDNAAIDADAAERVGHMQISALRQAAGKKIIQVRKALTRIKIGKYGVCERCGKMIDTDRLMILPETTVCVECEKKKEK